MSLTNSLPYLVVCGRVRDNEEAWLPESLLDLIGESSWCEPARDGVGPGVVCKLQDGSLEGGKTGRERGRRDGGRERG